MTPLPIDRFLPDVIARLRESRSLVLVAPPGAGKTTRVPPAILRAGLLGKDHPNLVMLQPRRVAARAAAMRIAEEQGWELGRQTGYHVRFDRKIGPETRCRVLTEGILTRQLLDDPFLEGVGAVLLDEFHERSLHTDLAIALLREVQQTVRDDLILVVMSATLAAEPVAVFLGGCPIIRAEGRTFPIEITHMNVPSQVSLPERVASAVGDVLASSRSMDVPPMSHGRDVHATEENDPGDILCFLPGAEDIRRSASALEPLANRNDLLVLPLHGSLPAEEQVRALRPADRRKVILATNIAETSLTIDGVRTVIDTGVARVAGYDAERGLDRLELQRISKASATQRAGRAGRTAPGRAIRLWTAKEHQALAEFDVPEVRRVDLAGTVLSLHAWGHADPRKFPWFEPPDEETLASAERLLAMLGALSSETGGKLTPLGKQLVALPLHPRLARLLLATADSGMIEEGAALAALLSEKDIVAYDDFASRRGPKVQGSSDLLVRLDLLREAERDRFGRHLLDRGIDAVAARQVARMRDELYRIASRVWGVRRGGGSSQSGRDDDVLLKALLSAYPDRVCRRRASDPSAGVMVGGGGVRLARESVVWQPEYFLALDARRDPRSTTREALVRIASGIDVGWLEDLFPQSIRRVREAVFDEQRQRVVGRGATLYRDLPLREDKDAAVEAETAGRVLGEWARPRAMELLRAEESVKRWLDRFDLLRRAMPEHPWPTLDPPWAGDAIVAAAHGRRSLDELRRQLSNIIHGVLPYPLDRLFDREAPETIEVPTGNRIGLDYPSQPDGAAEIDPPVLAVRLQELFGWTDTPRIAAGRVPVKLHLLGPNYRPVQVTTDLRSFWTTTYFQVRKDLKARYPKHSWPEDPLTARPQAKGTRRRPPA